LKVAGLLNFSSQLPKIIRRNLFPGLHSRYAYVSSIKMAKIIIIVVVVAAAAAIVFYCSH